MTCSVATEIAVAANSASSNISVYAIDPTTGALSPVPGSPFATGAGPTGVTVDPVGNFAYVSNETDDTISAYSINTTNGSLTAVSGGPFATPLEPGWDGNLQAVGNLSPAIIDTTGGYLYVSYQYEYPITQSANGILGYSISANGGGLTLLPSNPFAVGSCFCIIPMAIAQNGRFLYQSSLGRYMEGYSVDAATGVPGALTMSPFAATGADSIAIDPTSSFLYVSDDTDIALLAYSINSTTGALTPISGSPYATGGSANCSSCGISPTFVSVDSSGNYVYVQSEYAISSSIITAFSINPANGSLAAVPGSPFTVGSNPNGLVSIAFAPIP